MAGGLSLCKEHLPELRRRLNEECSLTPEDLQEVLHIDMELPPGLFRIPLVEEFRLLEPCGTANPRPVFAARGIRLRGVRVMGKGRNVLGFEAVDQGGRTLSLTWFCEADVFEEKVTAARGAGAWRALQEGRADLTVSMVYHPEINEWRGRRSLRYVIRDMHF